MVTQRYAVIIAGAGPAAVRVMLCDTKRKALVSQSSVPMETANTRMARLIEETKRLLQKELKEDGGNV